MLAHQSASQRASLQAAAELAIDEGDVPYHNSRPIPHLALGADDEAVLAAAGPLRPRERIVPLQGPTPALSTSALASTNDPACATEKETSWQEVPQSSSPVSSHHNGLSNADNTRNNSVSGVQDGTLSSSQRHLARMAQPRDSRGVPFKPAQPNYGQVLSFAEEEERDRRLAEQRMQRAKSPRTPRASLTPRLRDRPQSPSSPTNPINGAAATATATTPPKPRPLSAALQARLEKLATPKQYPSPTEHEPERPSRPRSITTPANHNGSVDGAVSSSIFDRLYASRKQTSPLSEEAESHASPSHPRPRYGPAHTPVTTPSSQQQEAVFQRLSQPKNKSPAHKDANGMVEYNPYSPMKKYYGGTTVITSPPTSAAGGPSPISSPASGQGNARIPKPTWDMVDRYALSRSPQLAMNASASCVCTECRRALPKQTVAVVGQPTVSISSGAAMAATTSTAQPLPLRPAAPVRPVAATTADASTVVPSAPAKPSGTKPPIVVRTRRYVPPAEEEEGEAAKKEQPPATTVAAVATAPQPVKATRRRSVPVSMQQDSPLPEKTPAAVVASPAPLPPETVAAAGPVQPAVAAPRRSGGAPVTATVKEAAPTPAPTPAPTSPHASAAATAPTIKPAPTTVAEPTTRAAVQATRRRSSSSSAVPRATTEPANDAAAAGGTTASPPPLSPPAAAGGTTASPPPPSPPAAAGGTTASPPPPFPPEAAPVVATMKETPAPVAAASRCTPAATAAMIPSPTCGVVQAVKRAASPPAPAAAPTASTATLTAVMPVTAAASPPSSSVSRSPSEAEAKEGAEANPQEGSAAEEKEVNAVVEVEVVAHVGNDEGDDGQQGQTEEESLWRVAPPRAKPTSSAKARAGKSVYERLAPPPIPEDKLKLHRHTYKKRCVRPPKPEILKDEDFACQLEDFSPEPRRPVMIKKKKPVTALKKTTAAKNR